MLLGGLIIAGAGLGHLQTLARTAGRVDVVGTVVNRTSMILAGPISRTCDATHDFFTGMLYARQLVAQNRALKDLSGAASAYTEQIELLQERIDQLRNFNDLPISPGRKRVKLDVVYLARNEGLVTLSGGSEVGIAPNMPVVNGKGLVAIVQTVSRGQCQAALITSFNLQFWGVDSSRKTADVGFVIGQGSPTLTMRMINPNAPIKSGDEILTSGLSTRLPYGIPIGRVISVEEDSDYGTLRATIDPAFDLGTLREVQVLE